MHFLYGTNIKSLELWNRFRKTLLKKTNDTSFSEYNYLRKTCVFYRIKSLQLVTGVLLTRRNVANGSKEKNLVWFSAMMKNKAPAWMWRIVIIALIRACNVLIYLLINIFFYKKIFYKRMSLKSSKTLRKY